MIKKKLIQKWKGIVIEVDIGYSVSCELIDIYSNDFDFFAEMDWYSFDLKDRKYLKPGTIFYWNVFNDESHEIYLKKETWAHKQINRIKSKLGNIYKNIKK